MTTHTRIGRALPRFTSPGATGYSTEVLADSPLFYLKLDETSGTAAADSSGNGRNATHNNGVAVNQSSLLTDGTGKAASYDATDDYTRIPLGSWMNVTAFTMECIIKPTSVSGVCCIGGRWEGASQNAELLYLNSGKLSGAAWINSAQRDVAGATTLTAGVRHVVAMRYDGANLRVYVDGVQDGTTAFAGTLFQPNTAGFEIGRASLVNTSKYAGVIDEFSFYGTALSDARLAAHAAAA